MLSPFTLKLLWWGQYLPNLLLLFVIFFIIDTDLLFYSPFSSSSSPDLADGSDPEFNKKLFFFFLSTRKTNFISVVAIRLLAFFSVMNLLNWIIDFVAPHKTHFRFINPHVLKYAGWLGWLPALVASVILDSTYEMSLAIFLIFYLPSAWVALTMKHAPNASLVYEDEARSSKLYVGNAAAARNAKVLKNLGVTAILELHGGNANPTMMPYHEGIEHAQVLITDNASFWPFWKKSDCIADVLPELLKFVETQLQTRTGGVVLLHCTVGMSRSVSVAAAWLVKAGGCRDFDEATRRVGERRPLADVSLDHVESLRGAKF